jgi:hypothetical protein
MKLQFQDNSDTLSCACDNFSCVKSRSEDMADIIVSSYSIPSTYLFPLHPCGRRGMLLGTAAVCTA